LGGKAKILAVQNMNEQQNPPKFMSEMVTFFSTEVNMNITGEISTSYPNQKYEVESFTLLVPLHFLTRL